MILVVVYTIIILLVSILLSVVISSRLEYSSRSKKADANKDWHLSMMCNRCGYVHNETVEDDESKDNERSYCSQCGEYTLERQVTRVYNGKREVKEPRRMGFTVRTDKL